MQNEVESASALEEYRKRMLSYLQVPSWDTSTNGVNKNKDTAVKDKSFRSCGWYHPTHDLKCICYDLCQRRDIRQCPIRTRFAQLINETDDEYMAFCLMNPCDRGFIDAEKMNLEVIAKGRS